jgi:hypothetical protein
VVKQRILLSDVDERGKARQQVSVYEVIETRTAEEASASIPSNFNFRARTKIFLLLKEGRFLRDHYLEEETQ